MRRILRAAPAAFMLLSCASTRLAVGDDHPASVEAEPAPIAPVGSALESSFEGAPGSAAPPAPAPAPKDQDEVATWTCPMHPQIQQPEPGNCPICGMKLKPVEPKKHGAEH